MIALIDLNLGNLQSVAAAFKRVGAPVEIIASPQGMDKAEGIILPGVGAFGDGMAGLQEKGFIDPLLKMVIQEKKPLLGICLGMQLLADSSTEHGFHQGLGLVPGRVIRLNPTQPGFRVPNIGWCEVRRQGKPGLLDNLQDGSAFYFVHSYWLECERPDDLAGSIQYSGQTITAAVARDNIFGCQFHPEKSQDAGLEVLENFHRLVVERAV